MIGRRSTILDEVDRVLFPLIVAVAVYVTFRGHNAPGGGFAGGLITGAAFVLRFLAGGALKVRRSVVTHPTTLIGIGLFVAVATAVAPLLVGDALLESTIWILDVPLVGEVKIVSSTFFDIGVYLLVVGVILTVIVALGADPVHAELMGDRSDEVEP